MEIQTLRYFLAVAREENMTRAASRLHVSQPTLSKRIKALEDELGQKLFVRHSFSIELTNEGRLLRDRAESLVDMADKIEGEFQTLDDTDGGELHFGLAESHQIRHLAREIAVLKDKRPNLHYHIMSGDTEQVTERLDGGLLDFAVICEPPDERKYDFVEFPGHDEWGVVVPKDHRLAARKSVSVAALKGEPLFASGQGWEGDLARWAGERQKELSLEGSFRLAYNAAMFARAGLGVVMTFDKIIDTSPESGLVFRPLSPRVRPKLYLIWGKRQLLTPLATEFLAQVRTSFGAR